MSQTISEAQCIARPPELFLLVRRVEPGVRQRIRDRGSIACMVTAFEPSAAVVIIAAMVMPALLMPIGLAITGTLELLVGGALMVAESRLGGEQISQKIRQALIRSDKVTP